MWLDNIRKPFRGDPDSVYAKQSIDIFFEAITQNTSNPEPKKGATIYYSKFCTSNSHTRLRATLVYEIYYPATSQAKNWLRT